MSGFGILMLIFGTSVLLTGIYMYTNHKLEILTMRPAFKNLTLNLIQEENGKRKINFIRKLPM